MLVKVRDGQVAKRPIYAAIAVTLAVEKAQQAVEQSGGLVVDGGEKAVHVSTVRPGEPGLARALATRWRGDAGL